MRISLLILLVLLTSSCARMNSIHRESYINDNLSTVSVDAKQRFLIATTINEYDSTGAVIKRTYPAVCAEPSPDAFAVYSAALEANASKANELTAALKATTGENGSTIGIRTEAIQLLRDAMFRLCEAYVSGGIAQPDYARMVQKYQKSMVTLIAIEQLTGSVQPAQIVLSSNASLSLNDNLFKAKENLDNARTARDKAKDDVDANDKEIKKSLAALNDDVDNKCPKGVAAAEEDTMNCESYFTNFNKGEKLKTVLVAQEKNVAEWAQVLEKSSDSLNLNTQAAHEAIRASSTPPSAETIASLSGTVKSLVEDVYFDDAINTCIDQMAKISNQYISGGITILKTPSRGSEAKEFVADKQSLVSLCDNLLSARFKRP